MATEVGVLVPLGATEPSATCDETETVLLAAERVDRRRRPEREAGVCAPVYTH